MAAVDRSASDAWAAGGSDPAPASTTAQSPSSDTPTPAAPQFVSPTPSLSVATDQWVRDGNKPAETPAPVAAPTPAAPAVSTTPAADAGAQAVADEASAAATAAGASPEQAAAAGTQAAIEYIEAQLDGKPFQVPKNVMFPLKRGNDIEWKPAAELMKGGMLEKDYRIKTAEMNERERQRELQGRLKDAEIQAKEAFLDEQRQMYQKALGSAEGEAQWQQFQSLYQQNPQFKQIVDDALKGRVAQARDAVNEEYAQTEAAMEQVRSIADQIVEIGQRYPSVDPERVRLIYSRELQAERLPISREAIEHVFKSEVQTAERYTAPLQTKLDELSRELQAVKAAQNAQAHNANTRQMIERAVNPVAAPVAGAPSPANPSPATPRLKSTNMRDAVNEWSKL